MPDVAQSLDVSASPQRTCSKEEASRGRKVKLLSEGNQSVPKATDVSPDPDRLRNVLLTAGFTGAEAL